MTNEQMRKMIASEYAQARREELSERGVVLAVLNKYSISGFFVGLVVGIALTVTLGVFVFAMTHI
jgi:hypothetical protein